jgi:hypothetical protein
LPVSLYAATAGMFPSFQRIEPASSSSILC